MTRLARREEGESDGRGLVASWPASQHNPRNGEADVLELADGRLFLVYTFFNGGGEDSSSAELRGLFSDDGGMSWNGEHTVQPNIGRLNVMCANLLSLADGRVALAFNVKNGQTRGDFDCRPSIIFSDDGCSSWSEPVEICADKGRYYVLENSRLVQLSTGRIIVPLALLGAYDPMWFMGCCAYSDDNGKSWRMSDFATASDRRSTGMVETGVVELDPTRRGFPRASGSDYPPLLMYGRSCRGEILHCYSYDGGVRWSDPEPLGPRSPVSPSLIIRIPSTGDLILIWNAQDRRQALPERRSPLTAAISRDEAQTWTHIRDIEPDISYTYCYPSFTPTRKGTAVLTYYRSQWRNGQDRSLSEMRMRILDLEWFYM